MDKVVSITGGQYKGRRLVAPPHARPTSHRAREALMSRLASMKGGSISGHVVDVCAGSGALGLELLSRGASHATFIDIDVRYVKANIQHIGLENQTKLIQRDASLPFPLYPYQEPLDILVADPPYRLKAISAWFAAWKDWVEPRYTTVCVEQEVRYACVEMEGWELMQQATYGRAVWTIWYKK